MCQKETQSKIGLNKRRFFFSLILSIWRFVVVFVHINKRLTVNKHIQNSPHLIKITGNQKPKIIITKYIYGDKHMCEATVFIFNLFNFWSKYYKYKKSVFFVCVCINWNYLKNWLICRHAFNKRSIVSRGYATHIWFEYLTL